MHDRFSFADTGDSRTASVMFSDLLETCVKTAGTPSVASSGPSPGIASGSLKSPLILGDADEIANRGVARPGPA
jgi:hypothetical protein